jgi:hypothetical protein
MSIMGVEREKETDCREHENLGAHFVTATPSPVLGYAISLGNSDSHFTMKVVVVLFVL